MSDVVEENFNLAANYIQSNHQEFNKTELLQFYAFYKQSTVGPLNKEKNARPSFFNIQERAKYDHHLALGTLGKEQAMIAYVELLTEFKPNWNEMVQIENHSIMGGVSVSRPKFESIGHSEKNIEDFIKEGNVEELSLLLRNLNQTEMNTLNDESGLGLIHWASDRGNAEILKIVINTKGIEIDLRDKEGQTALFYASSCGHKNCIQLLLKHGANKEILDEEGNSCLDVAYDDEIKTLLS